MGSSAREIEREIKATRERMDDNLTRLEGSAASSARRYGRFVAIGLGALVGIGIGVLIFRRTRKPTLKDRLDSVSVENIQALLDRIKEELPSVTVHVNQKPPREPGLAESLMRRVAPTIAGAASSALFERAVRRSRESPAPE